VELSTIIEDQEVESEILTNAEVLRPSEVPNEHMPYPQEFLGIQSISTLVKDQSLVKAPKPAHYGGGLTNSRIELSSGFPSHRATLASTAGRSPSYASRRAS
jgi:hypothetical protein